MSLCINPRCAKPKNPDDSRFCLSCGSELLLGGKYRVTRLLSGKGGFGNTYEVRDNSGLKVLKVLTHNAPKAVKLFRQEARVLQELNHPGIPKGDCYFIYHPRESDKALHCLVMEKIEGTDLEEYMKGRGFRPIDKTLALDWLNQLANILDEVHRHNFYHRDIKPSNVILKPNGQLVLIDFGAARMVTDTVLSGGKNTGIYTPGYAPPEQSRGHSVPQSDFYALGKTLVFLLTGKEPSDPKIYDIKTNTFHWRDLAPATPPRLAGLLDELMSEQSIDRPANTSVLLDKVKDVRANPDRPVKPVPLRVTVPEPKPEVKTRPEPPKKANIAPPPAPAPLQPDPSIYYAGFWLRFKASLIDSIILFFIGAMVANFACSRLQTLDWVSQLKLDFSEANLGLFKELQPLVGMGPEKWVNGASGVCALATVQALFFLGIYAFYETLRMSGSLSAEQLAILLFFLMGVGLRWLYFVGFEYIFKGTIGKMFMDLSVTDSQGKRMSLGRANRRYWSKILSAFPLYFGFFLAGWTKTKSALHDTIAGTRVINNRNKNLPSGLL